MMRWRNPADAWDIDPIRRYTGLLLAKLRRHLHALIERHRRTSQFGWI
jgi:hypothetical protein